MGDSGECAVSSIDASMLLERILDQGGLRVVQDSVSQSLPGRYLMCRELNSEVEPKCMLVFYINLGRVVVASQGSVGLGVEVDLSTPRSTILGFHSVPQISVMALADEIVYLLSGDESRW
jgi:hypothetical protein